LTANSTMRFSQVTLIGIFTTWTYAHPTSHVVHERRDYVPDAWIKGDRVEGSTGLPVRIGMTQRNLEKGHDLLMEVYEFPLPGIPLEALT
jgi:tripeptidyl-peptidase-1